MLCGGNSRGAEVLVREVGRDSPVARQYAIVSMVVEVRGGGEAIAY